jgi:hypothetical protein
MIASKEVINWDIARMIWNIRGETSIKLQWKNMALVP